jgi:hypothetical protein
VQAPFPQIALFVNALADALTCLLLIDLGRRLGSLHAGMAAALAWAVAPFSVTFAIGGLETSVYILLLTATVHAHLCKRRTLAALLGALSLLTRPDALILLGPLAVDRLLSLLPFGLSPLHPRTPEPIPLRSPIPRIPFSPKIIQEAAAFLLPVLAWLLFAALYFGSPIPHSMAAKSLAYHLPPIAALVRLLQHYATPFLEHLTFGVPAIAAGIVVYPFFFIVGARKALRAAPHCWPFLAYPWLYFAVFALANPLIFRWYLTPPLPVYFLVILMGIDTIFRGQPSAINGQQSSVVRRRSSVVGYPSSIVHRLASLILLIPFALSLRDWTVRPDHGLERPSPGMAWYQLELLYRQAAEILAPELGSAPEERLLAAGDVGVLGFFTGARILDTVGLNSPVTTRYYPLDPALYTINYAVPPDLILDQKPDFIVILEVYGRNGLLKESRFWDEYHILRKIQTDIYGSDGMLVFEHRP